MNKLTIKIATAVSSAALVASSFATPLLATTVEISGNGSDSDNTVSVEQSNNTQVTQNNTANISNNVNVSSNTGDNEAEDNTGGDVSIETGDSSANVTVSNSANSNQASVNGCCPTDTSVKIAGNGTKSDNDATVKTKNEANVNQDNYAKIKNNVDVDNNTGDNKAEDNTWGDVAIETGDADATVTIANAANANWAAISAGSNGGGTLGVEIVGNGSDSDNTAYVELESKKNIDQDNDANISNDVDVDNNTGYNKAEDNTGGEVSIETGDASATVDVSNMANFNAANLEGCGCIDDLEVLVKGNGTDSDNDVTVKLKSYTKVDQDNDYSCGGHGGYLGFLSEYFGNHRGGSCADVDVDNNTGDNKAEDNTSHDGDPSIETGDADADIEVSNEANQNIVGDVEIDFPEIPSGSSSLLLLLIAFFG